MPEVKIDRELLRAIGADTRIDLLKLLSSGRHTPTMLSDKMGLSVPTLLEHLDKLIEAGLVRKIDEGRKWKYYALTEKGESLIGNRPDVPVRAFIMLSLGVLMLIGPVLMQSYLLTQVAAVPDTGAADAEPMLLAKAVEEESVRGAESMGPAEEFSYMPYVQAMGALLVIAAAYTMLTAKRN